MSNFNIALLPGDGIGPEVVAQAVKALEAIGSKYNHQFKFKYGSIGASSIDENGSPLPLETLNLCMDSDAVLLGAIGDPKYDNDPKAKIRPEQGLLGLRKNLGLFANFRPVTVFEKFAELSVLRKELLHGVDFLICRELTGGIYFGEKKNDGNTASDLCLYSTEEIKRIAKIAFNKASKRRKHLTLVDKANVLETSRLWRKTVQEMSAEFPDVKVDYLFIDNAAMQILINPSQFDVLLCSNMFGDILSDEASVLVGSLGLLPSSSLGEKHRLYEPVHGSYPEAAGLDIANPTAMILCAAMMLDDFGLASEAKEIRNAIFKCIDNRIVTRDLDNSHPYTTTRFGDIVSAIIHHDEEFSLDKIKQTDSIII